MAVNKDIDKPIWINKKIKKNTEYFFFDLLSLILDIYWHLTSKARGVACHDFGYGPTAGVPGPQPVHILGEVKNRPIYILPIAKIVHIHILFFKFYLFIYFLSENDTPLIYFWGEIYLEAWRVYPIQAARLYCVHLCNGKLTPPPRWSFQFFIYLNKRSTCCCRNTFQGHVSYMTSFYDDVIFRRWRHKGIFADFLTGTIRIMLFVFSV